MRLRSGSTGRKAYLLVVGGGLLAAVLACNAASASPPAATVAPQAAITATLPGNEQPASPGEQPTSATPDAHLTPTTIEGVPTLPIPTPLPADQRDYELCVSIASDSNGYGHVSFLVPDPDVTEQQVAITYITPIYVVLQAQLEALGLDYLAVVDRSLSAGGLTIASSNYLESDQYFRLKQDRCKFVVVTPFYPDVAVDLASPEYYVQNLSILVGDLARATPASRILVLNFYATHRADFTVHNSGRGLRDERIAAFNEALARACQPDVLGGYPQLVCVDVNPYFADMGTAHVLGETTQAEFAAALYRENSYTPVITDYFARYPDGLLVGDGIHLSEAGRERLAQRLALFIAELNDDF